MKPYPPHGRAPAICWIASLLLIGARASFATVIYVDLNCPGPAHNGASWATAFSTVQQAINAAVEGDEVWVAAGTYPENLTLKSAVALYGGFAGTETSRDERDFTHNITLLDGSGKATVVTIASDATSQTVLDGFTIRNGYGRIVDGSGVAGGVNVSGGTPIISNNIITGCSAEVAQTTPSAGGGIYVAYGAMPVIARNTIVNNLAMFGGGVYALGGMIRDNIIAYNTASHDYLLYGMGGGLYAYGAVVYHNLVQGNHAPDPYGGGGGISQSGASAIDNVFQDNTGLNGVSLQCSGASIVTGNTIVNSNTSTQGSEVEFDGGTFADNLLSVRSVDAIVLGMGAGTWNGIDPVITNNTIIKTGTQAHTAVWSMYFNGERPVFSNNLVFGWETAGKTLDRGGNRPVFTVSHNDAFGNADNAFSLPGANLPASSGNINQDPLFMDSAHGDYRLTAGSPCRDAGNDSTVVAGVRDVTGAPRIAGTHVDIGSYEYGSSPYTVSDAAKVLRVAAGLSVAMPADILRLDVVQETAGSIRITLSDATRIAWWLRN